MKKSIITLILVLIIGTSFGQNYQVVRKIVATPDCRTRFLNSQNVQIFEVNSFDMTYNFLSSTQLQIRDYKNQVTIYKAQTSSPIFDSLPSFLDSIKTACLIFSDTAGIYGIVAGTNITIDNSNIKFPIINASGGGSSYSAKNGIHIETDTIKLGGNITEDTKLDNPNSKSVQIGSDGDAMNLNVPPPSEFGGLISTYTGFDYRSAEYMSFIGVLKSLNFAPLGFSNQDMVGTFTITGNPFDSIFPDGSVMIDGVWEEEGEVTMNKLYLTFLGGDLTFNLVSQFQNEQTSLIEGDNGNQSKSIQGDNASQIEQIIGNNAFQSQYIEGDNASQQSIIIGDNANQQNIIIGDSANQNQSIIGENGKISRSIIDSVNNANAKEEITSTSYLFSGLKVIGSDTIFASNSISPDGFVRVFRSGSLTNRDTLNENMYKVEAGSITLKLDSTGLNYGQDYSPFNLSNGVIKYEVGGVTDTLTLNPVYLKINPTFLGFYNKEPIVQPLLPLGSSTDDVIQVLQNLGLVRED